jgi:hypothetical protein
VHLLRQRSWYRVFRALDATYPTTEAFCAMLSTDRWLELAEEIAVLVGLVSDELAKAGPGVDATTMMRALADVYPRGLDCCAEMAEILGVESDDLLSILLHPSMPT